MADRIRVKYDKLIQMVTGSKRKFLRTLDVKKYSQYLYFFKHTLCFIVGVMQPCFSGVKCD